MAVRLPRGVDASLTPDARSNLSQLAKLNASPVGGERVSEVKRPRWRISVHAVLCPEGDSAEVAMFVHQRYRGLGLGRKLLGALLDEGRRRSLRRVWGITNLYNMPMLRLVHSFGFSFGQDPGEFWLELESANNLSAAVARAA